MVCNPFFLFSSRIKFPAQGSFGTERWLSQDFEADALMPPGKAEAEEEEEEEEERKDDV